MENRLKQTYPDCDVAIMDVTGAQSNFDIRIATSAFEGMSRIKQHQAIMNVFDSELKSGEIHALSIKAITK